MTWHPVALDTRCRIKLTDNGERMLLNWVNYWHQNVPEAQRPNTERDQDGWCETTFYVVLILHQRAAQAPDNFLYTALEVAADDKTETDHVPDLPAGGRSGESADKPAADDAAASGAGESVESGGRPTTSAPARRGKRTTGG